MVPNVTLGGLKDAETPVVVAVRDTVPVKPLTAEIVIEAVLCSPAFTGPRMVGAEAILKSGRGPTEIVKEVEWERDPLVPVTETVNEPAVEPETDRLEVPEPVILFLPRVAVMS